MLLSFASILPLFFTFLPPVQSTIDFYSSLDPLIYGEHYIMGSSSYLEIYRNIEVKIQQATTQYESACDIYLVLPTFVGPYLGNLEIFVTPKRSEGLILQGTKDALHQQLTDTLFPQYSHTLMIADTFEEISETIKWKLVHLFHPYHTLLQMRILYREILQKIALHLTVQIGTIHYRSQSVEIQVKNYITEHQTNEFKMMAEDILKRRIDITFTDN